MSSNRTAFALVGLLVAGYLAINFVAHGRVPGSVLDYVVRPGFWLVVAAVVHFTPSVAPIGKLGLRRELLTFGLMAGGFHVFMLVMGGVFSGFGNSPYSHQPEHVVRNLLVAGAVLLGAEMARARILCCMAKRWPTLVIGLTAVLFTVLQLVPTQFDRLLEFRPAITFLGETGVPLLAVNALASVLAYLGGAKPAIAYRSVLLAFEWLSPVLPDMTWGITALIGVIVPALAVAAVQMLAVGRLRTARRVRAEPSETPMSGLIAGAVFVLALFWFSLGLLPVYPSTVISGSMAPLLDRGDVVIAIKVDADDIEVGDVIDFRTGEMRVIHRVIEVVPGDTMTRFATKGDANTLEDRELVLGPNVKGKMVAVVPDIGRAVLFLRSD